MNPLYIDNCDISGLRYAVSGATVNNGFGVVAGILLNKGLNVVTYTAAINSTISCSFTVNVVDNEAPKFTSNLTTVVDACDFSTLPAIPTILDNCDASPTLTMLSDITATVSNCATKTASQKYTRSITRTWRATDLAGNSTTAVQIVYLRDMAPPTATCRNITVTVGNNNVTTTAATFNNGSSDLCSNTLSFAACKGSTCTNYASNIVFSRTMITPSSASSIVIPIRLRVTDGCGNINTCVSDVTLQKATTMGRESTSAGNTAKDDTKVTDSNPAVASDVSSAHGDFKCYPNPFADDLNISYNLTHDVENVILKVYDNHGKVVQVLDQKDSKAGYYGVRWNLSHLNSGMYQVCLELNGQCTKVERVIMIK